jgi:hypothetical protein
MVDLEDRLPKCADVAYSTGTYKRHSTRRAKHFRKSKGCCGPSNTKARGRTVVWIGVEQ